MHVCIDAWSVWHLLVYGTHLQLQLLTSSIGGICCCLRCLALLLQDRALRFKDLEERHSTAVRTMQEKAGRRVSRQGKQVSRQGRQAGRRLRAGSQVRAGMWAGRHGRQGRRAGRRRHREACSLPCRVLHARGLPRKQAYLEPRIKRSGLLQRLVALCGARFHLLADEHTYWCVGCGQKHVLPMVGFSARHFAKPRAAHHGNALCRATQGLLAVAVRSSWPLCKHHHQLA